MFRGSYEDPFEKASHHSQNTVEMRHDSHSPFGTRRFAVRRFSSASAAEECGCKCGESIATLGAFFIAAAGAFWLVGRTWLEPGFGLATELGVGGQEWFGL